MQAREAEQWWEEHRHDAVTHTHEHYHVTHNYNERVGSFDHLSYKHSHEHGHGEVTHRHYPHQNFEEEHWGEAHDHSHQESPKRAAKPKARAVRSVTEGGPGRTRRSPEGG